jgi:hypothetical protein
VVIIGGEVTQMMAYPVTPVQGRMVACARTAAGHQADENTEGVGGYVFPTIIARIVDVDCTGAGLLGPLLLLASATTLWAGTFAPERIAAAASRVVGIR